MTEMQANAAGLEESGDYSSLHGLIAEAAESAVRAWDEAPEDSPDVGEFVADAVIEALGLQEERELIAETVTKCGRPGCFCAIAGVVHKQYVLDAERPRERRRYVTAWEETP